MSAAPEKPAVRRGPRKEADIRAEVESQIREEMEAQIRAEMAEKSEESREEMEAQIRAEMAAEIQAQQAQEARDRAAAAEARPIKGTDVDGDPSVPGSITVHFVDDGLTLLGKVWYRGENLTITPGTQNWAEAHEILKMDEYEQEEKWDGRRFFRAGPWRGKALTEINEELLTDAERAQLAKAEQIRRERYPS